MPLPKAVRVTWREGDYSYQMPGWSGGTIIGDYTVPVAERIPDEILDYIRQNGGALRIKIRLKDDGVLIGWDVEERIPKPNWKPGDGAKNYLQYSLPGGDFREAQIRNGKVIDPGWQRVAFHDRESVTPMTPPNAWPSATPSARSSGSTMASTTS